MSKILEILMNGLSRSKAYLAKESVRRKLLARNDRLLADVGISRELLEEGVGAWPWRVDQVGENVKQANARGIPSARDFSTQANLAAMDSASRGHSGYFA